MEKLQEHFLFLEVLLSPKVCVTELHGFIVKQQEFWIAT